MGSLESYFDGEKQGATVALVLGVASLAFSFWLFRSSSPFRAMMFPVVLIGLLEVGLGVGLHLRTPSQVAALQSGLAENPTGTRDKELERMQRVQRSFTIIKIVEALLIAASVAVIFAMKERPVVVGAALGILLQASALLVFDVFAERRGAEYLAYLEGLPGGEPGAL
jgi:hypothetical protein